MIFANKRYALYYLLIACVALFVRFYQLGDINKPVFDEVYFPKFAYQYIQQQPFFHSHPPLAKYVLQGAITLYHALPWVNEPTLGSVDFSQLNPLSYRWANALFGFFAAIFFTLSAWKLSRSHFIASLVFAFTCLDGALIVASRFGLSNVHILFWGSLSFYLTILTLQKKSWVYPVLLSLSLGCVICVKWSGLSYWALSLTIFIILLLAKLCALTPHPQTKISSISYQRFAGIFMLIVGLPILVYSLLWIPDLKLNTKYDFVETHQQFFSYHKNRVAQDAHPYCSKWYNWPLMQRPISYYFEKLPTVNDQQCYKNIHSFGNPFLYWWSSLAMLVLTLWLVPQLINIVKSVVRREQPCITQQQFISLFIVCGYFACWLPWTLVSRCTFLYHYQSASVFSFFALALVLSQLQNGKSKYARFTVVIILLSVFLSFIYWLPFQLGIPLEKSAFYQRMWFSSWI